MVLCVIPGCGNRTARDQGVGFYRIPAVVTNKGEFEEKQTAERRKEWVKAISRGDTEEKQVLESERVCGKHFVSGKPAPYWNRYHEDWIPTLNLGKKKYGPEVDVKANAQRSERAKKREQVAIARQEREVAEKRQKLNESSVPVAEIDFGEPSTSTEEIQNEGTKESGDETFSVTQTEELSTKGEEIAPEVGVKDAECQTAEFEYMFRKNKYQAPGKDFFDSDDKVRFYTGLPSMEVLMVVFDHACFPTRNSTNTVAGSISRVYDCAYETTVKCTATGSCLPIIGVSVHHFKSILPLDCGDGFEIISVCLLAKQRPTLEDYAPVLSVCIWEENHRDH